MSDTVDTQNNEIVVTEEKRLSVRELKALIAELNTQIDSEQSLLNGLRLKKQEAQSRLQLLRQ